jgi:sigma54-dependent transcription regulator
VAVNNDFITADNGQLSVRPDGPNAGLHHVLYKTHPFNKHILLATKPTEPDTQQIRKKSQILYEYLNKYAISSVELKFLEISDPTDHSAIKRVYEATIQEVSQEFDAIWAYISPGTPQMHVAAVLTYLGGAYNGLRLLQSRPGEFTATRAPEYYFVELEKSQVPVSIVAHSVPQKQELAYFRAACLADVYKRASQIAAAPVRTVTYIHGETGTGKEHLARFLHDQSSRAAAPFVAINCGALQDNLLESRLFGYEQGAFTGANTQKEGLFEVAKGGTIFLDEVADMSLSMQQSLLRVIQEQTIQRIGSFIEIPVDVNIVTASHKSLDELTAQGAFRMDLYYRLTPLQLNLPPLRAWPVEDRIGLIRHLLQHQFTSLSLSEDAQAHLIHLSLRGNIRELQAILTRLSIFSEGKRMNKQDVISELKI